MKFSNLSNKWRKQFLGKLDVNDTNACAVIVLPALLKNPILDNFFSNQKKSDDDALLAIVVFMRLKHLHLLPANLPKQHKIEPLLTAIMNHYETCKDMDAAKKSLKPVIKAFLTADNVRQYKHSGKILSAVLKVCTEENAKDCADFLCLLNMTTELLKSKNGMPTLLSKLPEKGIVAAKDLILKVMLMIHEMKKTGSNPEEIRDMLERTFTYAKREDAQLPPMASKNGMTMMDAMWGMKFMLETEPDHSSESPEPTSRSGRVSPVSMFNVPTPPRLSPAPEERLSPVNPIK